MSKYQLIQLPQIEGGPQLYQIQALRDIVYSKNGLNIAIRAGELGGYIEKEANLSQDGSCWIYPNSTVCGNASVSENAIIKSHSYVSDDVIISGQSIINNSDIGDRVHITDKAVIIDSNIFGDAYIAGNSLIDSESLDCGCILGTKGKSLTRSHILHYDFGDTTLYTNSNDDIFISTSNQLFHIKDYSKFIAFCLENFEQEHTQRIIQDIENIIQVKFQLGGKLEKIKGKIAKYELTNNEIMVGGTYCYQIRALRDIYFKCDNYTIDVKMGELGGYIQNEAQLSHTGACWVFDNAVVSGYYQNEHISISGNAKICGNAYVSDSTISGNAYIGGNAEVSGSDVSENAYISDNAKISKALFRSKISGNVRIDGEVDISSSELSGNVVVRGRTSFSLLSFSGNLIIEDAMLANGFYNFEQLNVDGVDLALNKVSGFSFEFNKKHIDIIKYGNEFIYNTSPERPNEFKTIRSIALFKECIKAYFNVQPYQQYVFEDKFKEVVLNLKGVCNE